MICRIGKELESSLHSAEEPDSPARKIGLTEAGERNRVQQKQERVERVRTLLLKHRAICKTCAPD